MRSIFLGCLICFSILHAAEIQATEEWKLLDDNDTVAAGFHVRIDFETGQKWVKIAQDDTKNERKLDKVSGDLKALDISEVQVLADGAVLMTESSPEGTTGDQTVRTETKSKQQLDFDMMHRTLSQLPKNDQQNMGLPELPGGTVQALSRQQRAVFEERMTQIWHERQELLRKWEEEYVADLPQVLKDRIQYLSGYLDDPEGHLRRIPVNVDGDLEKNDGGGVLAHIIDVLEDLEYLLTDMDMTRDFHTLGGWPVVTALISDQAHTAFLTNASTSNRTDTLSDQEKALFWEKIRTVQARAVWVIGTAVKNSVEFGWYALEEIELPVPLSSESVKASGLQLLLKHLKESLGDETGVLEGVETGTALPATRARQELVAKVLYTLGSCLRGNRHVQVQFVASKGAHWLSKLLTRNLDDVISQREALRTAKKIMILAHDMVTDIKLHPGTSPQVDQAISQAFASNEWCSSVAQAALRQNQTPSLRDFSDTALVTLKALAPDCSQTWHPKLEFMNQRLLELKTLRLKEQADEETRLDPELHVERMQLLDACQEALKEYQPSAKNE